MQLQLLTLKLMNKLKGWFEQFKIFLSKGPTIYAQFDFGIDNYVPPYSALVREV